MKNKMIYLIMGALALGLVAGFLININTSPEAAKQIADYINILSIIFLRLIKMIIAPLVFSTLVVGIAHIGEGTAVGRIFIKTLTWFVTASFCSLMLGLVMVNIMRPGDNLDMPIPDAQMKSGLAKPSFSLLDFVNHIVPQSIVEAMATNEILQIVVFSIFFGLSLAALGKKAQLLTDGIGQLSAVMLKLTGYVMLFAPIAVFSAVTAIVAERGLMILLVYAKFIGGFYATMLVLWLLLICAGFVFLGPRVLKLVGLMQEPLVIAFSTASSEAAYPKTLSGLEQFGVPNRIAAFVLPIGYSFNLDGSMLYCSFAVMFIAQAYGMDIPLGTQITILLVLMLTSKGIAGVPRASLVVVAATLTQFNIPESGLLLIMGIDQFLDMGRSATNVIGNSIATAVVAKWEGALDEEQTNEADNLV